MMASITKGSAAFSLWHHLVDECLISLCSPKSFPVTLNMMAIGASSDSVLCLR